MKMNEFNKIIQAPTSGHYIVYTKENVLFDTYNDLNALFNNFEKTDILEIHLFDDNKEYRAITSRRGVIETVVDDSLYQTKYVEKVELENSFKKLGKYIQVINYVEFTNGCANIVNYRLTLGGKSND